MSLPILYAPSDPAAVDRLVRELEIHPLLAEVLVARGLTEPEIAYQFLHPSLDQLGSPRLLPDWDAACKAILGARERKETIFVHGDYDADGVTSASLFTRFLRRIGCNVVVHVPHRLKHGYGVHEDSIVAAKEAGAKLFLTCDCGVSAHEEVERAKAAGMAVVVTDHHTVPPSLPGASAVVNPHRSDSRYPFAELAGVGVVFRVCEGLTEELGMPVDRFRRAYLDLAVVGTVADVMPLVGENRVIARHGLELLPSSKKVGLRALMAEAELLGGDKPFDSATIGFKIGPRINAAGRIDDAARTLDLMLTEDEIEAKVMARQIEQINRERKEMQEKLTREAIDRVLEEGLADGRTLVIAGTDWHPGIIGLVANKLVERFYRPTFVMTVNTQTGEVKASGRSIENFNLVDLIRANEHLVQGGGHAKAAGFGTRAELVEQVRAAFEQFAEQHMDPEVLERKYRVDAIVQTQQLDLPTLEAFQALEPFGEANPKPRFSLSDVEVVEAKPTKGGEHLQLLLQTVGRPLRAIGWGLGHRSEEFPAGTPVDLVASAEVDTYNGYRNPKLYVDAIQVSEREPANA